MQRIRVGMRGVRVEMMGMRGIRVGMQGIGVGMGWIGGGTEGNQGGNLRIGVELMNYNWRGIKINRNVCIYKNIWALMRNN